jgi:hypothetical protein
MKRDKSAETVRGPPKSPSENIAFGDAGVRDRFARLGLDGVE